MGHIKALAIFSGGLDSILAVEIIRKEGIEVDGVYFETPFFPSYRAKESAFQIGLNLRIVDITKEMLSIIKKPRFGHGAGLNPCMDCHLLMCQKACEIMKREGYAFLITGEVLGQRPFSQTKQAMLKIQRECLCGDYLLRPLSAKCLPATLPESEGLIERHKLLDFKGRSRKPQMKLAQKLGIKDYPTPAGGCLLTDLEFSARLKDLLDFQLKAKPNDIQPRDLELLKIGRHFRINPQTKVVVGRNQKENELLKTLALPEDAQLRVISYPGPRVLIPYGGDLEGIKMAAVLAVSYSDAPKNRPVRVQVNYKGKFTEVQTSALPKESCKPFLISKA